ncbi:MAG: hypothetical protein DI606_08820 [Sphingobium sp.]|nr:MAG: hypothetical protein DI606_08820 [Sphingobium sp.]
MRAARPWFGIAAQDHDPRSRSFSGQNQSSTGGQVIICKASPAFDNDRSDTGAARGVQSGPQHVDFAPCPNDGHMLRIDPQKSQCFP